MKNRLILFALVIGLSSILFSSFAFADESVLYQTSDFAIGCTTLTQFCTPMYSFPVTLSSAAPLNVKYDVRYTHCSSMKLHVLVDGIEKGVSGVLGWPGTLLPLTANLILPTVAAGNHTISLQAEGLVSGCNFGHLDSWGGAVNVTANYPVICSVNSDCGTNILSAPSCSGNNVIRIFTNYTCNNPGTSSSNCSNISGTLIIQTCQYGCSLGSCNPAPTCSCNSDCGIPSSQLECSGNDVVNSTTTPTCTSGSCHNVVTSSIVHTCQYGCTNGSCNNETNAPIVNLLAPTNGSSLTSGLINFVFNVSDESGIFSCSLNVSGTVTGNSTDITKTGNNTLAVNLSSGNYSAYVFCLDEFGNRGLSQNINFLVSNPPACLQNSDCGVDGWIGARFCSRKNVYQNFITYTCNNEICSNSTEARKITGCGDGCSNGKCIIDNDDDRIFDDNLTLELTPSNIKKKHGVVLDAINLTDESIGNKRISSNSGLWVLSLIFLLLIILLLVMIAMAGTRR